MQKSGGVRLSQLRYVANVKSSYFIEIILTHSLIYYYQKIISKIDLKKLRFSYISLLF